MIQAGEALVSFDHISKTFPGQRALTDVSFTIGHGEIHALVGENGSGKSTLIKVLAGYHAPDPGGRIFIDGDQLRINSPTDVKHVGIRFVHQNLGLVSELSAAENVGLTAGFARTAGRISWSQQREQVRRLLARTGTSIDVDVPVADLRSVERSQVAIARALDDRFGAIRLLVLDEPTAALPPTETDALLATLRAIRAQGVSILYVSHRLDEILGLADQVTVLRDSRFMGTYPASGMLRSRLAQLIVGEEVTADVARSHVSSTTARVVTRVRDLKTSLLRGIDFDLHGGEILGFAGLSGSGREDVASALTGKTDARLSLSDDQDRVVTRMTPRRAMDMGLVLVLANRDPAAAIDNFTVRENVTLSKLSAVASRVRLSRSKETRSTVDWVRRLRIAPPDPSRRYMNLSGGNKQKVILAKWLNISPKVIVMDDPTSGVDIGARHAIYQLIREQAARGAGVIVCSSDFEDLLGLCDRVVALVDGLASVEIDAKDLTETTLLAAVSGAGSAGSVTPNNGGGESR